MASIPFDGTTPYRRCGSAKHSPLAVVLRKCPRRAIIRGDVVNINDRPEPETSLQELTTVTVAALLPAIIVWLTAPSTGDGPIIRLAFGVVGFWPSITLGLVFAALGFTRYASTVRQWLVYAVGFSVVGLVGCLIVWHNLVASHRADPSSQDLFTLSILAAIVIAIAPSAVARAIHCYLHRGWLAVEYALAACFFATIWAATVGPRLVIDL
jgi:hypothetical protein